MLFVVYQIKPIGIRVTVHGELKSLKWSGKLQTSFNWLHSTLLDTIQSSIVVMWCKLCSLLFAVKLQNTHLSTNISDFNCINWMRDMSNDLEIRNKLNCEINVSTVRTSFIWVAKCPYFWTVIKNIANYFVLDLVNISYFGIVLFLLYP